MKVNSWEIENGRAMYRAKYQTKYEDERDLFMSISWENDERSIMDFNEQAFNPSGNAPMRQLQEFPGGAFVPGLYARVSINGAPSTIIGILKPEGKNLEIDLEEFAATNHPEDILSMMMESYNQAIDDPGEYQYTPISTRPGTSAKIDEMAHWPGTPSLNRMTDALLNVERDPKRSMEIAQDALERLDQGIPGILSDEAATILMGTSLAMLPGRIRKSLEDALNMAQILVNQRGCQNDCYEMTMQGGERRIRNPRVMAAGLRHDSERTIGVLTEMELDWDGEPEVSLSAVQRDPEWMGLNPMFQLVKGQRVIVEESGKQPGRPGLMMMSLREIEHIQQTQDEFPPGEAQQLREILEWHGAREILWAPRQPG